MSCPRKNLPITKGEVVAICYVWATEKVGKIRMIVRYLRDTEFGRKHCDIGELDFDSLVAVSEGDQDLMAAVLVRQRDCVNGSERIVSKKTRTVASRSHAKV